MTPTSRAPRVLLVEPESTSRRLARAVLEGVGIDVATADDPDGAVAQARRTRPDVVIVDLDGRRGDDVTVAQRLRGAIESGPIVGVSAHLRATIGRDSVDQLLVKPLDRTSILGVVARHVTRRLAHD